MAPNVTNHTNMMGPNTTPIFPVPCFCMANKASRMRMVTGTTHSVKAGEASSRPSTAESTVTAGVSAPSPKNNAVPATPITMMALIGNSERCCVNSAMSASTPPSPLLSLRSTMRTYFNDTVRAMVQKMSDSTPRMASGPGVISPPAIRQARSA
jgi:hypothetical protein